MPSILATISLIPPPSRGLFVHQPAVAVHGYVSVLDACCCPRLGKQVHAQTVKTRLFTDALVQTKLLQMYARCGRVDEAWLLFNEMDQWNLYCWAAIINVFVDHELFGEAFALFELLLELSEGQLFGSILFPVLFKISSGFGNLKLGRQLHGFALKCGIGLCDSYVCNGLIDMYGKCQGVDEAEKVLRTMLIRDTISWNSCINAFAANGMFREAEALLTEMVESDHLAPTAVSWNALIGGCAQNGHEEDAVDLFYEMLVKNVEPDRRTIATILPVCSRLLELKLGKQIHGYAVKRRCLSSYVMNALIDFYRKCGDMGSARQIYDRFSVKDVVSCNKMISGYLAIEDVSEALKLFDCMEMAGIRRDLISWNCLISGFVDIGRYEEALAVFGDLVALEEFELSSFTLASALTACANLGSITKGMEVHLQAIVRGLHCNVFVGGALIKMFSSCRDYDAAQRCFNLISVKDMTAWNSLISASARCCGLKGLKELMDKMREDGYEPGVLTWNVALASLVENDFLYESAQLFFDMQEFKIKPDEYSVCIMLPACSKLGTLERGKSLHTYSVKHGYDSDDHIGASLVDMYAKCGVLNYAKSVYERISCPNYVCHNAMIAAFAVHGEGEDGVTLFWKVIKSGMFPKEETFVSALSLCVHAGLIRTGFEIFFLMEDYIILPNLKHYTCLVDLLSRSGYLHEAYALIIKIPLRPDSAMWGALLGGCVKYENLHLGEIAAKKLLELQSNYSGFLSLSNLYARAGLWTEHARIRHMISGVEQNRNAGCSWIKDKDTIHLFFPRDETYYGIT